MVAMLLQAHREIEEIRNRAELEAAALLAGSVREAPRSPWGEPPSEGPDTVLIDLTEQPASVTPLSVPSPVPHDQPHMGTPEYFDFLRGALVDDEPLGPRAD
jgi:hypothetical protein